MEWINYNHLFYFWTVAHLGSVSKASGELQLSQPTISEQIHKLEESLGVKLFERTGRGLRLSEAGHVAFHYADDIFRSGRDLRAALNGAPAIPTRLAVGLSHSLSKLVAYQLIVPALRGGSPPRLLFVEEHSEQLLARLALRQLDLVLSDSLLLPAANIKAFSRRIAHSGISFMSARKPPRGRKLPQILDGAPFLMPDANTPLHNSLQSWFNAQSIRPTIVGEFSDPTLLEVFGGQGTGMFAVPTVIEREIRSQYKVETVGRTADIMMDFYAITAERRISHPSVEAISKAGSAVGKS